MNYSPHVQARIEQFLDAVEDRLRSGGEARARRRAIVDDLETQIVDSLPENASSEEVETLLARLDPPAAYEKPSGDRLATAVGTRGRRRFNRNARNGLIALTAAASLLLLAMGYLLPASTTPRRVVEYLSQTNQTVSYDEPPTYLWEFAYRGALLATGAALLATTVFGWLAARQIGRSDGGEWGVTWAAVEALLLPMIAAGWIGFGSAFLLMVAIYDTSNLSDTGRAMVGLIGSVLTLILWSGLIFLFVRTVRGSHLRPTVIGTSAFAS